ncbi:polysaccharide pyruvyl transferase family protein [Serratia fonticola]
MSKRVYLVSCSGRPNYGDELITATWLTYLHRYHPDYEVWLDTPEPGNAHALFMDYHPNFKVINTLWKICWRNQHDLNEMNTRVENLIANFGSPDIDLNIDIFRSSDIVHVLGGGYINAKWKENYSILFACAALKKLSTAKTYATGLSLYPHEDFLLPDTFDSAIASFDRFSVRDEVTAERFSVTNDQDDVFLSKHLGLLRTRDDANIPDILCCIQSELADDAQFSIWIKAASRYLLEQQAVGKRIGYCEAIPGADYLAYEALRPIIPDLMFYPFSSLWRDGMPLGEHCEIITTRFHHHLVGACLGLKGVALNVDREYYANKHGSLITLGTGWEIQQCGEDADQIKPTINADFQAKANSIASEKFNQANEFYRNS